MSRKIRKHIKIIYPVNPPVLVLEEVLHKQKGDVPLNIVPTDRISFSVLRNENNSLRKIENMGLDLY